MKPKLRAQFFQTSKDTCSFYSTGKKLGLKETKWLSPGSKAAEQQRPKHASPHGHSFLLCHAGR